MHSLIKYDSIRAKTKRTYSTLRIKKGKKDKECEIKKKRT